MNMPKIAIFTTFGCTISVHFAENWAIVATFADI